MPYTTTKDIMDDILFRAGEIRGSSEWDLQALTYLNRAYKALAIGGSEFVAEYVDDWWWLRDTKTLTVLPSTTGLVSATTDSTSLSFAVNQPNSLVDYRIRFSGHSDVFRIASHTGGTNSAVLDSVYTGDTNAVQEYTLMKVRYDLDVSVSAILSPVIAFQENPQIMGMQPERMDTLWPLSRLQPGVPQAFCLENERVLRFSAGGRTDGRSMRMEYRFKPLVTDLVDSLGSVPLLPISYRHLLADMALTYVYIDKNDDRAVATMNSAKAGISAMLRENRRRLVKMDNTTGAIFTRPSHLANNFSRLLRTESGLIIG